MGAPRKRCSRYINVQRHTMGCAPAAVANVVKWHRVETSYKSVAKFCEEIGAYIPRVGMLASHFAYVLKLLKIRFRLRRDFNTQDIEHWLNQGRSLILVYPRRTGVSHAVFIDKIEPNGFRAWNIGDGSKPFLSKNEIEKSIKLAHSRGSFAYAYIFQPLKA